jgi:phosphate transport system protein
MIRGTLEKKMQMLQDEVLVLGSMVENAILAAVDALQKRDIDASKRIYLADQQINDRRFKLENECITLIATQQPMARDLRIFAATLEVLTELERMGDYAKGIARINILIGEESILTPLVEIPVMAEITVDMLHKALMAFVDADEEQARLIPREDDKVDELYNQVYHELVAFMINNGNSIDKANYMLWVAHNLERTADRVTNICERAIYIATGELIELSTSDDEVREVRQ